MVKYFKKLKRELGQSEVINVRPFKFLSWHSGFNYFIGKHEVGAVFIKVCAGKYNTIEAESVMMRYNKLGFFPEVILFADTPISYVTTKLINTKKINKNISYSLIVTIILQAEKILDQLYANGIIHRDIRPENLLLTINDKLLLFDFGWAVYREFSYKKSDYAFIEKILNNKFRGSDEGFDDALSMYLSFKEIFGNDIETMLKGIKKRIGRLEIS